MTNFMERWFDPALEVDMGWNEEDNAQRQITRLQRQTAVAWFAFEVPRRLGGDATPEELAADKALSKRLHIRSVSALRNWKAPPLAVQEDGEFEGKEELKQQGAQINWVNWFADYKAHMQAELRLIATSATKTGELKAGNRACQRLLNELNTIGLLFKE